MSNKIFESLGPSSERENIIGVKIIQDVSERAFSRGAGVGDKPLMDTLIPCAESWRANTAV
ncbi:MAG: hypothetical protein LBS30_07660 [Planctomycetota bacterium]|jgi:hypothetical protein|nr:hypothetical protein [Planctomycetota bacterium]